MANRVVPDRHGLINIGKLKENLVTEVELHAPGFAGGSYAVMLQRPRERQPYPVTARTEGGRLIWTVQTADTAIPGTGKLECRWYGDKGEVDKSQTYMVRITDGLPDPTDAPEAYAGYVAQVARNAEAAKSAASVAGAAAGRAETALKALEDGIASGDFRGDKGEKGDTGPKGQQGEKGEKGDKGDNTYTWVKYASQEPTEASHSMGDIPDDWRGEYNGPLAEAPTDWKQYKWYKIKGEKGDTGSPATLASKSVTYQVSDSGTIIPSGSWGSSIPVVSQGKYLWTKTEVRFNTGDPIVSYSVARMGIDGSGSVSSVAGVSPDSTGNVTLTANDVGALAASGGDMAGAINMNGQPISGLNDPTEDTQAARKGYVDAAKTAANAYTDTSVRKAAPRNLLDNSDFRDPVNQRGQTSYTLNEWGGYCIDRWAASAAGANVTIGSGGLILSGCIHQPISSDVVSMYNGKVLTLAVKIAGTVYCCSGEVNQIGAWNSSARVETPYGFINFETENSNMMFVVIDNSTTPSVVEWAALYEGEYTAETLPEYKPKGYGAELLECQRYYYRRNLFCVLHPANKSNLSEYRGEITFPVEMRTNPQCAFDQNEGNVVTGPVNNQFCLLIGTPNELGWCTTGSRLEFIADL